MGAFNIVGAVLENDLHMFRFLWPHEVTWKNEEVQERAITYYSSLKGCHKEEETGCRKEGQEKDCHKEGEEKGCQDDQQNDQLPPNESTDNFNISSDDDNGCDEKPTTSVHELPEFMRELSIDWQLRYLQYIL